MVYVSDVADAIMRAWEAAAQGEMFDQAIEVGPILHKTVREVAELVNELTAEVTGKKVEILNLPMRPGEIPGDNVTADTQTLSLVAIDPNELVSLDDGMRKSVRYFAESMGSAWRKPLPD
jgi:UDP-glucose 4-epimerase